MAANTSVSPVYFAAPTATPRAFDGAAPASTEALVRDRELAKIRKDQPALTHAEARTVADARTATAKRGHSKRSGPCFARPDLVRALNG